MTQEKTKGAMYAPDQPDWRPVIAIGLSTFAVVTTEMLPIGLLTPMAASFGSSVGAAGLAISLPALLAGLFAPVVLVVSGSVDTLLLVAGHFMAYTFVRPSLQMLSGVPAHWVGLLLFAYGAAGVAGNFIAGALPARRIGATLILISGSLASTLFAFHILGTTASGGTLVLIVWGLAYGGVSVALQTWMMRAAPDAIEVATSLFVAVFNLAIALGSLLGGQAVDRLDLQTNILMAAVLTTTALGLALVAQRSPARSRR